mmetsp:Transcript_268/g.581  ORF Transcript_268/g.581 Transcript_268/m.581 type:complete len:300 (+) Transcript_268:92-991(+)
MGSGASISSNDKAPFVPKYISKNRLKNRFDHAKESTLNDCILVRTSWYQIELTFSKPLSAGQILSCPFFHRLNAYALHSTLLRKEASFKARFLDDLLCILLQGVTSYKEVERFNQLYASIPLMEFFLIGETLIETLREVIPTADTDVAKDKDLILDTDLKTQHTAADLTADLDLSNHTTQDRKLGLTSDFTFEETSVTYRYNSTRTEVGKGENKGNKGNTDSEHITAWITLWAKFQRHLWAVRKGRGQPEAHCSMYAQSGFPEGFVKDVGASEAVSEVSQGVYCRQTSVRVWEQTPILC